MNAQDVVDKVVPSKYHGIATIIVSTVVGLSPWIGRGYHALVTGGGLRGIFSAIWLGTNLPKSVQADVENTKQAVVSGNTDILTKPAEGK